MEEEATKTAQPHPIMVLLSSPLPIRDHAQ